MRGWYLAHDSRLLCRRVISADGLAQGFLLGFPITSEGCLLADCNLPAFVGEGLSFIDWLAQLSGKWLAILLTDEEERIYLDPGGSLTAVYCPSMNMVAGTTGLILYTEETQDRSEFAQQMPIPEAVTMYPIGMTPRHGIERLLPNHSLDLRNWKSRRDWPRADLGTTWNTAMAAREVAAITRRNITAVAARFPLQLALTAGYDSRTILACARSHLGTAKFFTSVLPSDAAWLDVSVGRRIAKDLGLAHEVIAYEEPDERDKEVWLHRTGCAVGNNLSYLGMRSAQQLDRSHVYLTGYVSETARDFFGPRMDRLNPAWRTNGIRAENLIALTGAPVRKDALARAEVWLAGQPLREPEHILALFYLEQRVGGWVAVLGAPFADISMFELWPLNNRRITEIMVTLPHEYRRNVGLNKDIIAQEWPELLRHGFNEPRGTDILNLKLRRLWRRIGV